MVLLSLGHRKPKFNLTCPVSLSIITSFDVEMISNISTPQSECKCMCFVWFMFKLPTVCAVSGENGVYMWRPAVPDRKTRRTTPGGKTIVCEGNENLILQRKCSSAACLLAHRLKQLSIDQIFAFPFRFFFFFIVRICNAVCSCRHTENLYLHTHTHTHTLSAPSIFIRGSLLTPGMGGLFLHHWQHMPPQGWQRAGATVQRACPCHRGNNILQGNIPTSVRLLHPTSDALSLVKVQVTSAECS